MTKEKIIQGLQFTVDMFLFDPTTGETFKEPRNDMDKTTIDACKGAIELLEQQPCEDAISRKWLVEALEAKGFNLTDTDYNRMIHLIRDTAPSVLPKPKTGHWIFDEILDKHYYCSECKLMGVDYWGYCPYCGCRMVKPQESEDKEWR